MGLIFNRMKEPVFLKESSTAEKQLEELKALEPQLNSEGQKIIQRDITCLEYGIAGEKNIAFELKNSHMPIYILHDVYFESGDLSAQIDYMVFTKKICFIIECKNLFGNIEIDSSGSFKRTMYFGTHKVQEGIYSPITQNQRHLELIKKIKTESKSNVLLKFIAEKSFNGLYYPIVVLANPKTILNDRYAKKDIKNQIIRADQLIAYMKHIYAISKEEATFDDAMLEWAQSFLKININMQKSYLEKYACYRIQTDQHSDEEQAEQKSTINEDNKDVCPRCGGKLIRRTGKFGEFFGCSNFPKCRYTAQIQK